MPRGQPDYGAYAVKEYVGSLADMAELAVRQGSVVSYDRRGDVILIDDFESPVLAWERFVVGAEYIRHDSTHVRAGSQAMRIHTAALAASRPYMTRELYALGSKRIGVECHFSNQPARGTFHLLNDGHDGTRYYSGRTRINFEVGTLEIEIEVGVWQVIAIGLVFLTGDHFYTPLKLVVDYSTFHYVRILLGNVEYDVSAYPLRTNLSPVSARNAIGLQLWNNAVALAQDIWFDDVIFSQSEP